MVKLLLLLTALQPVMQTATAQQADPAADRLAAMQWGETAGGLQLRLDASGVNTGLFTGTQLLLSMNVVVRNASDTAVPVDFDESTYDFEYEIDGTWYGFIARNHTVTPNSAIRASITATAANHPDLRTTIAPGSLGSTLLTVPLAGRSRALQLFAITPNGPGARFEPKPGPHVLRVRPGRTLDATRQAPVSNAVAVSFQTPLQLDTAAQTVTFAPWNLPPGNFRFAAGPAEAQVFIRDVLARPSRPFIAPGIINSAALQILPPLPFYDLPMPRSRGAPAPSLPATASAYRYFVRSGDEAVAGIQLSSVKGGLALDAVDPAAATEPVSGALQRLAALPQLRGGDYEPRLLRITGTYGTATLQLLWLHAATDRADLFYWPRDPGFRGWTKLESDKLYTLDELLKLAQVLPVAPRHDEAWAVTTALACAKAKPGIYRDPLLVERALVEIGVSPQQDHVVWYVFIPSPMPDGEIELPEPGAAFRVDEADGSCKVAMRE